MVSSPSLSKSQRTPHINEHFDELKAARGCPTRICDAALIARLTLRASRTMELRTARSGCCPQGARRCDIMISRGSASYEHIVDAAHGPVPNSEKVASVAAEYRRVRVLNTEQFLSRCCPQEIGLEEL